MKKVTHIDAHQLAFLLNTGSGYHKKIEDCEKMFQIVEHRLRNSLVSDRPPHVISVDDFEKVYPNYPIKAKIRSISRDYLSALRYNSLFNILHF